MQELLGQYGDAANMFTGAASTAEGVSIGSTAGGNALFAALPEEVSMRAHTQHACHLLKQHVSLMCPAQNAAVGTSKHKMCKY